MRCLLTIFLRERSVEFFSSAVHHAMSIDYLNEKFLANGEIQRLLVVGYVLLVFLYSTATLTRDSVTPRHKMYSSTI